MTDFEFKVRLSELYEHAKQQGKRQDILEVHRSGWDLCAEYLDQARLLLARAGRFVKPGGEGENS